MAIVSLDIENPRIPQPKSPKSLKYVFVGLLIGAIGFLFMGVGRESKLYAPVRDRVGHLTSSALALHSASLEALKQKFSSSSTNTTTTDTASTTALVKIRDDRIAENFPITQMQLPSLYNLILPPIGEDAFQLGVPSRQTLLYDLSLLNRTSDMNWEWRRTPPLRPQEPEKIADTDSSDNDAIAQIEESSSNSGGGGGGDSEDTSSSGRRTSRKLRSFGDDD